MPDARGTRKQLRGRGTQALKGRGRGTIREHELEGGKMYALVQWLRGGVIKASTEECDVPMPFLRHHKENKGNQRKSGPTTPPARVAMRVMITNPALGGPEVISPAFLFRF